MPRYIIKAQLGKSTLSMMIRDVERGEVVSATFAGLREILEELLKRVEAMPDVKVEYE